MSISNSKFALQRCSPKPLPAKLFGYMLLCHKLKENMVVKERAEKIANLPLVSSITNKFTPQGVVHAYLSFLQY